MEKQDVIKYVISIAAITAAMPVSVPVAIIIGIGEIVAHFAVDAISDKKFDDKFKEQSRHAIKQAIKKTEIELKSLENGTDLLYLLNVEVLLESNSINDAIQNAVKEKTSIPMKQGVQKVLEIFVKCLDREIIQRDELFRVTTNERITSLFDMLNSYNDKINYTVMRLNNLEENLGYKIPHYITNQVSQMGSEFSFRDEIVSSIYEAIHHNKRIILLNGLGGIGKTAVARALFHKIKNEFTYVAWIEFQSSIKESLLKSFKIYENIIDADERYKKIEGFLRNYSSELVLFIDDVSYANNSYDEVGIAFITSLDATIILTSRRENIAHFESFSIQFLTEDQCIDVFYKFYNYDKENKYRNIVSELVNLVSCHTLSVELLARAANRPNYSLQKYLHELTEKGFNYPDLHVETDHNHISQTIAKHLKCLFDIISLTSEQQRILKNFSIMPNMEILSDVESWIDCHINDLHELVKLGWLQATENGYCMHPIIKEVILLNDNPTYKDCNALIISLNKLTNRNPQESFFNYKIYQQIAESVLSIIKDKTLDIASLNRNVGLLFIYEGKYDVALGYYKNALKIRKMKLNCNHPDLADTFSGIAEIYRKSGKYRLAKEYNKKDIDISENNVYDTLLSMGASYNNTALVYLDLKDYKTAYNWSKKAIKAYEYLGLNDHAYMALIYHNYTQILCSLNRVDEAIEYHNKQIEINKKILEDNNPDLAMSYTNLARTYMHKNDYEHAIKYLNLAVFHLDKLDLCNAEDLLSTYVSMEKTLIALGRVEEAKLISNFIRDIE